MVLLRGKWIGIGVYVCIVCLACVCVACIHVHACGRSVYTAGAVLVLWCDPFMRSLYRNPYGLAPHTHTLRAQANIRTHYMHITHTHTHTHTHTALTNTHTRHTDVPCTQTHPRTHTRTKMVRVPVRLLWREWFHC